MVWTAYNGYYTPPTDRDGSPIIPRKHLTNPRFSDSYRESIILNGAESGRSVFMASSWREKS